MSSIKKIICESLKRLAVSFVLFAFILASGNVAGTNSYFTDEAYVPGMSFESGYWIPDLEVSIEPENPDGESGFYENTPCARFSAGIGGEAGGARIFYQFSTDGILLGRGYAENGDCVDIPDGNPVNLLAWAQNEKNPDWKSGEFNGSYKVDTICPVVEITDPDDDEEISGSVSIKGTVKDDNPHHYWLVVENEGGDRIAGPGTVNEDVSFENEEIFEWDTTEAEDGEYVIKLEARDAAGNKCPDQAPVIEDPEEDEDSVDWITVNVKNAQDEDDDNDDGDKEDEDEIRPGDVVINEVMWMGSDSDSDDEWIELRNMTDREIEIGQWRIENAKRKGGEYMIPANNTIEGGGFFLIANWPKNSENTALNVEPDVHSAGLSLSNDGNGDLILKYKSGGGDWIIVDEAEGDEWPAGLKSDGTYKSMERNDDPGDGSDDDWHTCLDEGCNDGKYWDSDDGNNYGTPGDENLSENDPTSVKKTEEPVLRKEISIEFENKLDLEDGLYYEEEDIDQKIEKLNVSGLEKDLEGLGGKIGVDLSKLEKIFEEGRFEFKVDDLNLAEGIKIENAEDGDVILEILISRKKVEESGLPQKEGGNSEGSGENL